MYEKAKAIVVEKPKHAVVQEIPICPVDAETIVVETKYSAISTGTEMKVWGGLSGHLGGELWYPLVPGYEAVGEIVFVGDKVEGFAVGERVMANEVRYYPEHCHAWGGQCGLIVKNPKTSPSPFDPPAKIPDNVSYQEAVAAYLAAVAKKGIDKVAPQPDETVLVIGMGLIGISAVQLAKLNGSRVIAMDINAKWLALAGKFTDECIDAHKDDPIAALESLTDGRRADVVIECSGNPAVVNGLPGYLRDGGWERDDDGGRIHLQGDYPDPLLISPYQKWFTKNLRLSMTCAIRPGGKEEILGLISEGKFDAKTILESDMTQEMPVDQAQAAYETVLKSRNDVFKILLQW